MDNRKEIRKNRIIMITPLLLPGAFITMMLGIGFFVFLIPLVIFMVIVFFLAKKLDRKDSIAYPLVQYPFLILLIIMMFANSPFGLEIYFIPSLVFVPNMVIGILYFWLVKNKRWYVNAIVCLITMAATVFLFPV
jgi:hypothetical protein